MMRGTYGAAFTIYNSFKYGVFYEMERRKLENCRFCYYDDFPNFGIFCFQTTHDFWADTINISICIDKFDYKYYDELVEIFKTHVDWLFEISEYDYCMHTFDIIFKNSENPFNVKETYRVSSNGIDKRYVIKPYEISPLNTPSRIGKYYLDDVLAAKEEITLNDKRKYFQLPIYKELTTFELDSPSGRVPKLSKPPIFNPPATICYWTDGTKTVVKCQEVDTYSPEAGLALCYMKKVLGNTSRDLNKELHKYIPEEKED